jgi:hypothetical protein
VQGERSQLEAEKAVIFHFELSKVSSKSPRWQMADTSIIDRHASAGAHYGGFSSRCGVTMWCECARALCVSRASAVG